MTESQISALLDATYELEALLSLSQIRQGAPERIADLIRMKADTIAALAYDGKPDAESPTLETDNASDTYSLEEEETLPPPPETEKTEECLVEEIKTEPIETPTAETEQDADKETAEEAVEIAAETEIPTDISSLQRLFSLNDKFRFRRELFSGNDNDFTATLHRIAACDSLNDAEDYLYSDLQWDPDSEAVKAFIGVIANYFN